MIFLIPFLISFLSFTVFLLFISFLFMFRWDLSFWNIFSIRPSLSTCFSCVSYFCETSLSLLHTFPSLFTSFYSLHSFFLPSLQLFSPLFIPTHFFSYDNCFFSAHELVFLTFCFLSFLRLFILHYFLFFSHHISLLDFSRFFHNTCAFLSSIIIFISHFL